MNQVTQKLQARKANWLPLPLEAIVFEPELPRDGLFKGEIIEYFARQGIGKVKTFAGVSYVFAIPELEFIGGKPARLQLKLGSRVGFDISQSSRGLRVQRMKVY